MSKPIELDLRRDLPKVLAVRDQLLEDLGLCHYSTPCAVGAMMSPAEREAVADYDSRTVTQLIKHGFVAVPAQQKRDFVSLQSAFDQGDPVRFERTLKRLEKKYTTA